jgi:predicted RNase H-like nuclease (RuvC/YqgF family)
MSGTPCFPDDPEQCRRLLDDLLRRNEELRQQAEAAQRTIDQLERQLQQDALHQQAEAERQRAEEAQRKIDELERVLEQTAAEYQQLQEKHAELVSVRSSQ